MVDLRRAAFAGQLRIGGEMSVQAGSIWEDPDVRQVYDLTGGQPMLRFFEFNGQPDHLGLVAAFVQLDMENGEGTPAEPYVGARLAGVRLVEAVDGKIQPGWTKFFINQIDRNNSLLWDQHHGPADAVAAVAEWVVATIERHGWGPDGNSTRLGQCHSNALALAAEAGGGVRLNPATGRFEYGDGSDARRLAGVG